MTLGEWLRTAAARLSHSGIPSAPMEAQMLAGHVLQKDRAYVLTHQDQLIQESHFEPYLDRRSKLEPLAYILGWREFFGRRFQVDQSVLIPRQETELLIEIVLLRFPHERPLKVFDLGTGSGVIAITLQLERPNWTVTAGDISEPALNVARGNAEALGTTVDFAHADLFPASAEPFDLIVSNPPYVARGDAIGPDVRFEPDLALYAEEEGLAIYRRLSTEAQHHMAADAELWVEIGMGQSAAIQRLFLDAGWKFIGAQPDLARIVRVLGFGRG